MKKIIIALILVSFYRSLSGKWTWRAEGPGIFRTRVYTNAQWFDNRNLALADWAIYADSMNLGFWKIKEGS